MRLEYKYLISNKMLPALRNRMMPYMELDPFTKGDDISEYTVRSIYYDTTCLRYFHEKIDGIKVRKKLRIRGYNEKNGRNVVFLEIKRKYENYISKNRSPLLYHNVDELLESGRIDDLILNENNEYQNKEDAERFIHHIKKHKLKPIVLIIYDREAFFSKFNKNLRITFDKNLRYLSFPGMDRLYEETDLNYSLPDHSVLEIKFFGGYPIWLRNIVEEFKLTRQSVSKYTICLEDQRVLNPLKRKSALPFISSGSLVDMNNKEEL